MKNQKKLRKDLRRFTWMTPITVSVLKGVKYQLPWCPAISSPFIKPRTILRRLIHPSIIQPHSYLNLYHFTPISILLWNYNYNIWTNYPIRTIKFVKSSVGHANLAGNGHASVVCGTSYETITTEHVIKLFT